MKNSEWKLESEKLGTEWSETEGRYGEGGGSGGEPSGNKTVMVVDRGGFTPGSW